MGGMGGSDEDPDPPPPRRLRDGEAALSRRHRYAWVRAGVPRGPLRQVAAAAVQAGNVRGKNEMNGAESRPTVEGMGRTMIMICCPHCQMELPKTALPFHEATCARFIEAIRLIEIAKDAASEATICSHCRGLSWGLFIKALENFNGKLR